MTNVRQTKHNPRRARYCFLRRRPVGQTIRRFGLWLVINEPGGGQSAKRDSMSNGRILRGCMFLKSIMDSKLIGSCGVGSDLFLGNYNTEWPVSLFALAHKKE